MFCFRVYDRDNNQSIERVELLDMFTSMLLSFGGTGAVSPALKELIDDFVDSIYDSFDADRSESLEFHEVCGLRSRPVAAPLAPPLSPPHPPPVAPPVAPPLAPPLAPP